MSLLSKASGENSRKETVKHAATTGNTFEKIIQDTADYYKELQLAYIQKSFPPTRWIPGNAKSGGKGFLMHVKGGKSSHDFVGCYRLSVDEIVWKPIFIECKSTKQGQIAIVENEGGIKVEQIKGLLWLDARGIDAIILWEVRESETVFAFTPTWLIKAIDTKKSLSVNDCIENHAGRVRPVKHEGRIVLDFLGVL